MKNEKMKAPISILLTITDKGRGNDVLEYLNANNYSASMIFSGKGTAESDIADMFGFGLSDRDIVACIIPVDKQDQIIADVRDITRVEVDEYGLCMLLDMSSASSSILELVMG